MLFELHQIEVAESGRSYHSSVEITLDVDSFPAVCPIPYVRVMKQDREYQSMDTGELASIVIEHSDGRLEGFQFICRTGETGICADWLVEQLGADRWFSQEF